MFIFYDTETTGTNIAFDQILQFAAILTDDDLNEVDRFEIRCRCLPWVIPAPMALWITRVSPEMLDDPSLPSHYDMMNAINEKLDGWPIAIYAGYNSIRFDEPLLQRAFWLNLLPPYRTVTNGNARIDILPLAQAASYLTEQVLTYPSTPSGHKGFKLDMLAPLNGFSHDNAHDALSDVEATIYIARRLKEGAPQLWMNAVENASKASTAKILQTGEPVLVCEYYGRPFKWWGTRIDNNGATASTALMARLDRNWHSITNETDETILNEFDTSPGPIRKFSLNKAPIVYSAENAKKYWGEEISEFEMNQSLFLKENISKRTKVVALFKNSVDDWPSAQHLEQKIFDGFPSPADNANMESFHKATWHNRPAIMSKFSDERYRQIAQRILYDNKSALINPSSTREIERQIASRLNGRPTNNELWRTIPDAEKQLADVRNAGGEHSADAIEVWLAKRAYHHALKQ